MPEAFQQSASLNGWLPAGFPLRMAPCWLRALDSSPLTRHWQLAGTLLASGFLLPLCCPLLTPWRLESSVLARYRLPAGSPLAPAPGGRTPERRKQLAGLLLASCWPPGQPGSPLSRRWYLAGSLLAPHRLPAQVGSLLAFHSGWQPLPRLALCCLPAGST